MGMFHKRHMRATTMLRQTMINCIILRYAIEMIK